MNKHILELAYKAGYGTRWTSTEQFDQFIEKFAQLIVRECADQVSRGSEASSILEHFGVEA
jgi:hypothetical protein